MADYQMEDTVNALSQNAANGGLQRPSYPAPTQPINPPQNQPAGPWDRFKQAPEAAPAASDNGPKPWERNWGAPHAIQEAPSAWEAIKANAGARWDTVAAALLQDEGSDRSRYAMKRAERSQQEAALREEGLSTLQRVGVQAADIGTGLAASGVAALAGPEAAAAVGGAYFGAQGMADELRSQAAQQDFSRYDVAKAGGIAAAQGIAGEFTGGLANAGIRAAAPAVTRAATVLGENIVNPVTSAIGRAAPGVGETAGYLAGGRVGQAVGRAAGTATNYAAQGVGYVGGKAVPLATRAVSGVLTSAPAQHVIGGAATGSSMQMISNLANGRPIGENVGEAAMGGAIAGGATGAAAPVVRSVARRIPTTLSIARENVLGGRGRYEPTPEAPAPEAATIPQATAAGEGAIPTGAEAPQTGAIPTADTTQPGSIPGMGDFNPEAYGRGPQGAWRNVQPGQGVVGGAPGEGLGGVAGAAAEQAAKAGGSRYQEMKGLVSSLIQDGSSISEKAIKNMSAAEINSRAQGVKESPEMINRAKDTEGAMDMLQQRLENTPVDSPEYTQMVDAITNLSLERGSAAAHARANTIAVDSGMPTTSRFHDIELTEGINNSENPRNVAKDIHGLTTEQIESEHKAIRESRGSALPMSERSNAELAEKLQTYESHFNATNKAYKAANSKWQAAQKTNRDMVNDIYNSVRNSEQPELFKRAQALKNAWNDYETLNTAASNDQHIDTDRLAQAARTITEQGTYFGIMPKMRNVVGDAGTFNPVVDLQAWQNFNQRTRQMHPSAPKGTFKDALTAKEDDVFAGVDLNKPGTILRAGKRVVTAELNRRQSVASQAKGARMLREATRPQRAAEQAEEALRTGDTAAAAPAAEEALNTSGINTSGPELAATPAQEVAQAQGLDTAGQAHVDRLMRGAQAQVEEANAQAAAARAQRPAAPVEPVVEAPVETAPVATEAAPAAPQEPVAPYEGIRTPSRLETPTEAPVAPAEFAGERAPRRLAEKAPEEVKPVAEETPAAKEPTPVEELKTDEPVAKTATDKQEGESYAERNTRVANMAKKMVEEKTKEVLRAPAKKVSTEERAKAEGMQKGIKDILEYAQTKAAKEGVHEADILHAVMSQAGGLEATFKQGFGLDAIKGRVNDAVTIYKKQVQEMTRQAVDDADKIIRRHLGEAKVGATREAVEDRIKANLKAVGMEDSVINSAIKAASEVTPNYTPRQVAAHARRILRENTEKLKPVKPENDREHIASSRKALYNHVDSLGVDTATRAAVKKVINNYTQVGASGKRPALTESEQGEVIEAIQKALQRRAEDAEAAIKSFPQGSKARVRQGEKAEQLSKAANQHSEVIGSLKNELSAVRKAEADATTAREAAEKRSAEVESQMKEMSDKLDKVVKDQEAAHAKALADMKDEMREEASQMPDEAVEQFGRVVAEDMPTHTESRNDPEYEAWKTKIDVAVEELRKRKATNEANFISHFASVIDKGLKNLEELPEERNLALSAEDYTQMQNLYQKYVKGDERTVQEAGGTSMGNFGIKMRTWILGHRGEPRGLKKGPVMKQMRERILINQKGVGEAGIEAPGVSEKPKKSEGVISTPKSETKAKPALTKEQAEIKKQETKIKRLKSRLNNDELWIHDDERGTKWKVAQSQLKSEQYKLEQMKKGK